MTTWYEVSLWNFKISPYKVESFTDKTVSFYYEGAKRPTRNLIVQKGYRWFPTREEALTYVIDKLESKCKALHNELQASQEKLAQAIVDRDGLAK